MKGVACCGPARAEAEAPAAPAREAPESSPDAILPSARKVPFRWCCLPGGSFRMGTDGQEGFAADGEGPARRVAVGAFAVAAYAVTNAQFGDFVRETGYATQAERQNWSFVFRSHAPEEVHRRVLRAPADTPWWLPVPRAYWAQPEGPGSTILARLDHPVVHVSWDDAQAFCRWSGTQLPSEAQWEYAARGGLDGATFPWGDELAPKGRHRCNVWQGRFPDHDTAEDGFAGTAPVHAFAPNGFGLYNVVGNVWEWCRDGFSPTYHRDTPGADPLFEGDASERSQRGGSFLCHRSYCNRYRVAARGRNTPDSTAANVGFRVVMGPSAGV